MSKQKRNPVTVTRTNMTFDAGHRLIGHESKCASLHGHGYKLSMTCETAGTLDSVGRVVDFSIIKGLVGKFLDDELDHTMILNREDPFAEYIPQAYEKTKKLLLRRGIHRGPDFYRRVYVVDFEPTSENILAHICEKAVELFDNWHKQQPAGTPRVFVKRASLWETRNCYSSWSNPNR